VNYFSDTAQRTQLLFSLSFTIYPVTSVGYFLKAYVMEGMPSIGKQCIQIPLLSIVELTNSAGILGL
jgi:hypothetical protein